MFPSVARVGDLSRWFSSTATDLYRGGSPQIEREAVVVFFDSALSLIMHLLVLIGCFSMLSVGSRRICVSVGLVDGDRAFPRCLSSNRKTPRFVELLNSQQDSVFRLVEESQVKGSGKKTALEGKALSEFQCMWSIKQQDLAIKERLSKMILLAKKEPLADYEEALNKKLINDFLSS
ncbi:hypothetical protein F2Q69_00054714 [Brassica cretica]|uniref:Uncharacterized protein n=1 Tax=Brassica cretica TaxID=69181 RepID=A0A8S9MW80_BRACR|nr:hypothetical protein F2Q69_00054714 [Brassica cretica]